MGVPMVLMVPVAALPTLLPSPPLTAWLQHTAVTRIHLCHHPTVGLMSSPVKPLEHSTWASPTSPSAPAQRLRACLRGSRTHLQICTCCQGGPARQVPGFAFPGHYLVLRGLHRNPPEKETWCGYELGQSSLGRFPFRAVCSLGCPLIFPSSDSLGYWPFSLAQGTLVKLILLVPVPECQVVVVPER